MTETAYREPYETKARRQYPAITDRRDLPWARRAWQGRKVAVHYTSQRGSYRRRTAMGWAFGTLTIGADQHVVVIEKGVERKIHFTRVVGIYDLTRKHTIEPARRDAARVKVYNVIRADGGAEWPDVYRAIGRLAADDLARYERFIDGVERGVPGVIEHLIDYGTSKRIIKAAS